MEVCVARIVVIGVTYVVTVVVVVPVYVVIVMCGVIGVS